MNAVGRLGRYISRSVNTVSGPFHPFGGAVDIVVVEQKDGSFKSSPWYVRFGKFQGVLKATEKVVSINVNGVEAGFFMYLDNKGEAYFLREVDVEEGETVLSPSSSSEDTDGQSSKRLPIKSKSCNYDAAYESGSATQIGISNGKVVARTTRRSRILGLVFGRKSMKEVRPPEQDNDAGVVGRDSLERAEIAADLLEVKWSTNLISPRSRKDTGSHLSSSDVQDGNASKDSKITDKETNVDSLVNDSMLDNCAPLEKIGSAKNQESPMRFERYVEDNGIEMSCLVPEYLTRKSIVNDDDGKLNLKNLSKSRSLSADDADRSMDSVEIMSKVASEGFEIHNSVKLETCPIDKCPGDSFFNEKSGGSPDSIFPVAENEARIIPSFLSSETSTSSRFGLDADQASGTTYLSSGTCEESFFATLQTTDLACEVNSKPKTILNEREPSQIEEVLEKKDYYIFSDHGSVPESCGISSDSMEKDVVTEIYSETVAFQPLYDSVKDEPRSIFTVSSFSSSTCQPLGEKSISKENKTLEPVDDPQISTIDQIQPNFLLTEVSEERLLFGDLDDLKGIDPVDMEEPIIHTRSSSTDRFDCEDLPDDARNLTSMLKTISSEINIPAANGSQCREVPRIARSLPNMGSDGSGLRVHEIDQPLSHTLDSDSDPLKQTLFKKDVCMSLNGDADNDHQLSKSPEVMVDSTSMEELKNGVNPVVGISSRSFDASNGSWRGWPNPFGRSASANVPQSALDYNQSSDAENIRSRKDATEDEKDMPRCNEPDNLDIHPDKMNITKKKIRATAPTSEQLASLNLKEGRNTVEFTFSTPMLGKQQVDAQMYLWKWDTRIVISDVDGTITRSDLLGQVMPWVGVDWSQTGVAHFFSAIKENGYQLLFLSARAISQAYITRQFLFNLKQDGKSLPEGPVVISPDGLFPSLYREVVRRAPHEFKIACLEDIKALFPPDRNPFYAGFGNRDTDEFSYLKVGIPRGKIFIINPKGEIVVNRRVDTKSYTSFHAHVNDMFPPMASSEQQEDFNQWNFWKLPPPDINI